MNPKDLLNTVASGEIRPDYYKVRTRIEPTSFDPGTIDLNTRRETPPRATVECLALIDALDLNFNLGNALKYLWRAGRKTASKREDLRKCLTYLQAELDRDGGGRMQGGPGDGTRGGDGTRDGGDMGGTRGSGK